MKCMTKNPTDRLTMNDVLDHPYLAGAEDMGEQWVAEFERFNLHKKKKEGNPF